MNNDIRATAKQFLKEYKLGEVTLSNLRQIIKSQGYTIIEYNHILNDEDVANLIESLKLDDQVSKSKGFTYADRQRRLVFLHEDLSENEKLLVLAHEEGHIYCDHFSSSPIIGKDVIEEHEANEFAHYILNKSIRQKIDAAVNKRKKALCIVAVVLAILLVGGVILNAIQKEQSYFGEYYLTSTGKKYHEEECIFVKDKTNVRRMTIDEFKSGDFEPCGICLPHNSQGS